LSSKARAPASCRRFACASQPPTETIDLLGYRLRHALHKADPDLQAALRQLPEAQRAAVILYYYADLPVGEIAHRLGSNGLAVRANLSRGRRRLRQLLGDDDG